MAERGPRNFPTFVGLFIALGVPVLVGLLGGPSAGVLSSPGQALALVAWEWTIAIALLLLVLYWERKPLGSIGIRKLGRRDALLAVVGFFVGAIIFAATTPLLQWLGLGTTAGGIAQLTQLSPGLRTVIVLTAGITEEILFRGYPIERLAVLTGRIGLGAAIAYAVFVALHIPLWGLGGAIQIGLWSLVVTGLYVWRRNLPACVLMHVLNDAYAFFILPVMLAQYT